jgi:hypothetical protein
MLNSSERLLSLMIVRSVQDSSRNNLLIFYYCVPEPASLSLVCTSPFLYRFGVLSGKEQIKAGLLPVEVLLCQSKAEQFKDTIAAMVLQ